MVGRHRSPLFRCLSVVTGRLPAGTGLFTTNLRVQNQLTPHVALQLDFLNLFNRKNYDIAYEQDFKVSPTAPVVPDGVTVHPAEPFQAAADIETPVLRMRRFALESAASAYHFLVQFLVTRFCLHACSGYREADRGGLGGDWNWGPGSMMLANRGAGGARPDSAQCV